ncbi:helix-turn-helix protein [Micromonospora sp. Llam0]|nr:helix-turn-helix protein [Micromonospora sp. Llam0]
MGTDGATPDDRTPPHDDLSGQTPSITDEESTLNAAVTPLDGLPALLSVPRAAALLGLSRASAYRYAAAGELPSKRLGGRVYIVTAQLRPLLTAEPMGEAA